MVRFKTAALILLVSTVIARSQTVTCSGLDVPPAAALAAEAFLAERWLIEGPHVATAFEVRPGPPNPFDVMGLRGPALPPLKGHVWGQGLACRAALAPGDSGALLLSYYVGIFTFHEGVTWSPPDRGGLIHVLAAIPHAGGWRIIDRSGEQSILLPGAIIRKPDRTEIPKRDRATGVPCAPTELWTGMRCARPRA
jgi:hypothetical protein